MYRGFGKKEKKKPQTSLRARLFYCSTLLLLMLYFWVVQRLVAFRMITSFIPLFKHFKAAMSGSSKYDRRSFRTAVLCVFKFTSGFSRDNCRTQIFSSLCHTATLSSRVTSCKVLTLFLHFSIYLGLCLFSDPNALGQHGPDHALIGGVVAVVVFITLCLIIVLGRYLARHKGKRGRLSSLQ